MDSRSERPADDTGLDDPYLWLEDVTGQEALAWVEERNAASTAALAGTPLFAELREQILEVYDADDRIPWVVRRGEHLYNVWRDAEHPRGLWRRTTLAEYRTDDPDWEVLLDLDALATAEDENWVWAGATFLPPAWDRCLVSLSRGGADASVVREFDPVRREFVAGGFTLAEAKTDCTWIDADTVFVATDRGPGSLTRSGYPRTVVRWSRGTPLETAEEVHAARPDDMMVAAWRDHTSGVDLVEVRVGFFTTETFVLGPDVAVPLDVPADAEVSTSHGWLLVRLRSDWTVGDRTHPEGALLAQRLADHLAGRRDVEVVFEPGERTALQSYHWTRNHLLVTYLDDVRTRIEVRTPGGAGRAALPPVDVPQWCSANVVSTDPYGSDEVMLAIDGFLTPPALMRGVVGLGDSPLETLRTSPAHFDASRMEVRQGSAVSTDGTAVPYFVVGEPGTTGPTLLSAYGGFEVARLPAYSAGLGRAWLARGGTYVLANIRGGGEFGPRWHRAALKANRPRAYEDFAAVAADLVRTGVTVPAQLGAVGGSNGGLLMGNMVTGHPDLFGAVVAKVPLFDLRRYHLLLAGASWMAEYGDPDDPDEWTFMRGYSPYHLLRRGVSYPALLVTTSTRDDRVHPAHARKFVARMEEYGGTPLYYENIEGGHAGAADNAQAAYLDALGYAFLWGTVGAPPSAGAGPAEAAR